MANVGLHSEPASRVLSTADFAVLGAASGAATRALCQPLDVLKIRLQLQVESPALAKFRSTTHAAATMLREEGAAAFWKGHLPAQYLSITYGLLQFSTFEELSRRVHAVAPWTAEGGYRPTVHFAVGFVAGVAATLVSYPFDVVRTRLVAQSSPRLYSGTLDAAAKMASREGAASFFRGIVPTFAIIGPYTGFQFAFYTLFAQILDSLSVPSSSEDNKNKRLSSAGSVTCGALSGLCAKTAVYPFDLVKKRLQVQGFEAGRASLGRTDSYRGMTDCFVKTAKAEGLRGFFKGLTPGLLKAVASTAVNFWLYEQMCFALTVHRKLNNDV